jgi:hypothetical protein
MNELLSKLSSYNLFNYLFPGVIFAFLADAITSYTFIQSNIVIGLFLYYFIGLVISRFGSLVIEPLLKHRKIKFIKYVDYKDFVDACKKDDKLETLLEVNNTYRTLCSLFLLLPILELYEVVEHAAPVLIGWRTVLIIVSLFLAFLFSYKKQIGYIVKRIKANGC